jgi:NAD dependent epimerase/dehydratase family enzyme
VPKFAMRAALGGEKAEALGLSSTCAVPERLHAAGFAFADTDLSETLQRLVGRGVRRAA